MPGRITARVETGKAYRLLVHRLVRETLESERATGEVGRRHLSRAADWGPALVRCYDAATRLDTQARAGGAGSETGDLENIYRSLSLETSISATEAQQAALLASILENIELANGTMLYSGRETYGRMWPFQASTEVDGYIAGLRTTSMTDGTQPVERVKDFTLLQGASYTRRMRAPADQLADWDRIAGSLEMDETTKAVQRRAAAALGLEKFDGLTAARVQQDAVYELRLPPGRYALAATNFLHYHPFDFADTENYKVTLGASYLSEEVTGISFSVGENQSADVRVLMVPQRHQILYRYFPVYLFSSLFFSTFFYSVNLGTYADRLPWYPKPYAYFADQDTGANEDAMSQSIARSRQYAIDLAEDRGFEIITPYSVLLLIGRVGGSWTVRLRDLQPNDLAGVVDIKRGGDYTRYYIWRRTTVARHREVADYGVLQTSEVTPYDRNSPPFIGAPAYQPI